MSSYKMQFLVALILLLAINSTDQVIAAESPSGYITVSIGYGLDNLRSNAKESLLGNEGLSTQQLLLIERTKTLEAAVIELQQEMVKLKMGKRDVSCHIKTVFDGIISASGNDAGDAKSRTLEKCAEKTSANFCQEDQVICG